MTGSILMIIALSVLATSAPTAFAILAGAPGTVIFLLAVLPTDKRLIVGVYRCMCMLAGLAILSRAYAAISIAAHIGLIRRIRSDTGMSTSGTSFYPYWLVATKVGYALVFVYFIAGNVSHRHDPPRVRLDVLWRKIGLTWAFVGLLFATDLAVVASTGGLVLWYDYLTPLTLLATVLSASPGFRVRAQAALLAHGEEVTTAAGIAAMIGGTPVAVVQTQGRARFRAITLDQLSFVEMADQKPNPALFERSKPARLGDVDAFLTHSWSDCAAAKWAALQAWRRTFVAAHGREPRVWLDKACIDQTDIDANLMCLPVFLAGCRTLLICCGESYLERMWCVHAPFRVLRSAVSRYCDDIAR